MMYLLEFHKYEYINRVLILNRTEQLLNREEVDWMIYIILKKFRGMTQMKLMSVQISMQMIKQMKWLLVKFHFVQEEENEV